MPDRLSGLGELSGLSHLSRLRGLSPVAALVSRVIAAVVGGYGLAALTSVAALALPLDKSQAVLTGMLSSFLVYAAAVIWVFAARSARRAWVGLVIVALPLALAAWSVWTPAAAAP